MQPGLMAYVLVAHPMTDHWERCLASAIARRAHSPRGHDGKLFILINLSFVPYHIYSFTHRISIPAYAVEQQR
jgi:hypothetical protein